jgi:agmatinase
MPLSRVNPEKCRIGLLGICSDENSSFMRGPAEAPGLIREAFLSESSNSWTENGTDLGRPEIFFDAGDIAPDPALPFGEVISRSVAALLAHGLRPIVLGGDHAISAPVLAAMEARHEGLSILHIDAHPDLYDDFQGNPSSHASPFARVMERGKVKRLVQIGIRTINSHQRAQAERFGVEVIEMKDWRDGRRIEFNGPVYLSLDLDGLDPAFAPGVSHREPGGLSTRQVIDIIQHLVAPLVGADIVEYNPRMDTNGVTAMVAAKFMKEISAVMLRAPRD